MLGSGIAALASAALLIPLQLPLGLAATGTLVFLVHKFHRDNRATFVRAGIRPVLSALGQTALLLLPILVALLPGVAVSLAVGWVTNYIFAMIDSALTAAQQIEHYPPWHWKRLLLGENFRVLRDAPLHLRLILGSVRQFLLLANWLFYAGLGWIAVRLAFFFFARVFASHGGRVTFCLADPAT